MRPSTAYAMYSVHQLLDLDQCAALVERVRPSIWREFTATDPNGLAVRQSITELEAPRYPDLYARVQELAFATNDQLWGFHLDGMQGALRVVRYRPGYRHDWHVDHTAIDTSKLAMSMVLNSGFQGGGLELLEVPHLISPAPGEAVFFPAYHGHRVNEVTAGERYVLLAWFHGPRFR